MDQGRANADTSSGGALAPQGADARRMLDHMGKPHLSGRRRLARFEYAGRNAYHVVCVTNFRGRVLVGDVAEHAVQHIRAAAEHTKFELLSFVVMPDHVHALVTGRSEASDLIRFVQRFKQQTGFAYKKATSEQLWQLSFYDRIVRKEDDVAAMARYIVENPERAGLVSGDERWAYVGGVLVEEDFAVEK